MSDTVETTTEGELPETGAKDTTTGAMFSGKAYPLIKLLLKNILLTAVTLGIYRFWAKTWVRRYFWNNVSINKEPFEYTGQPKELLMGFLIALAVLVPLGIIDNVASTIISTNPGLQIPFGVAFYGTLFLLIQFAFYRMWRYRMTRTAWRGIHFSLDGSALNFVARSFVWTLVSVFTLGLASPWARTALARYRIENSQFGDHYFSFNGSGKDLILPWLSAYAIPLGILITWWVLNSDVITGELVSALLNANDENISAFIDFENNASAWWLLVMFYVSFPLLLIWYKAREFRYFVNATRLGGVTIKSELSIGTIVGLFVVTYGLIAGIFAVIFFSASFLFASSETLPGSVMVSGILILALGMMFILLFLIPMLTQGFLRYQLVKRFFHRFSIDDVAGLETVVQTSRPAPARGEGFADALDVGAF